jgi:hypothetical protein
MHANRRTPPPGERVSALGTHPICTNHAALGRRLFNTHLYPSMLPAGAKVIYVSRRGQVHRSPPTT